MMRLIRTEFMNQDGDTPLAGKVEASIGGTRRGDPPGRLALATTQAAVFGSWSGADECAPWMKRWRPTPEQIVLKLREVEVIVCETPSVRPDDPPTTTSMNGTRLADFMPFIASAIRCRRARCSTMATQAGGGETVVVTTTTLAHIAINRMPIMPICVLVLRRLSTAAFAGQEHPPAATESCRVEECLRALRAAHPPHIPEDGLWTLAADKRSGST